MYAVFKENGPFVVGWDSTFLKTYLLPNKHTWTSDHNLLYLDNPAGTGFSHSDSIGELTDHEVGLNLVQAMAQAGFIL